MSEFCTEIGYGSMNKFGEQLCGDCIKVAKGQDGDLFVMVLADGLGSGVKANILSTLTATIVSTMMAAEMGVEECVSAIADTLPVCSSRKIAYSTFTIIRIRGNLDAEIIQYDNPHVILLRDGKHVEFEKTAQQIGDKTIYISNVRLMENDAFIAMSDGAIHAGVGNTLNFGWQRDEIISFLEGAYKTNYTAKMIASLLLDQCDALYGGKPGDDTTIATIKIRRRSYVNLMIGPPQNPEDVDEMMKLFFSCEGKKIVSGGTTSMLAAEHLNKELKVSLKYIDPSIPPTAQVEGIDLVTEGVITINRVLDYARDYVNGNEHYVHWGRSMDGASSVARMLLREATDINFFVGRAINPAHQNPDLPINFSIKMRLVDELIELLKAMGKRVSAVYY